MASPETGVMQFVGDPPSRPTQHSIRDEIMELNLATTISKLIIVLMSLSSCKIKFSSKN